jgi:ribosomal protein L11 methylase PrmA
MSKQGLLGFVASLRSTVERLSWRPADTTWAAYAKDHNYSEFGLAEKRRLVREYLAAIAPRTVWDLGANTGSFSRVAREVAPLVISFDVDPAAVELNHREIRNRRETGLLALQLDLMNPSPPTGWAHEERSSLEARGPADALLALALVHHLAIANNVPLPRIAELFARLGRALVIEFVPKSDSQVERLLRNRPDVFPEYTREGFERAFAAHYDIRASAGIPGSERSVYLMHRRKA